jgi:hypothetical protein
MLEVAGGGEFCLHGQELVVGSAVEEHFDCADELDLYARVLQTLAVFRADGDGAFDTFAV